MIIQALNRYYQILAEDEKSGIPLPGYSSAKVSFALNISLEGNLLDVLPLKIESTNQKKLVSRLFTVPQQKDHGVKLEANFMCDTATYVLGIDQKGRPQRTKEAFILFKELHNQVLRNAKGHAAKAVLSFLNQWDTDKALQHPVLKDSLEEIFKGGNLIFRLDGEIGYLHDDPEIKKLWEEYRLKDSNGKISQCLVTGEKAEIERVHTFIKNVRGTKSNSGSIVSFNASSYESYGKEKSYNSPISIKVAFAYTTALNHMLLSTKQKIQIGDTTTVFWAESPQSIYPDFAAELLNPSFRKGEEDNESAYKHDVKTESLVKDVLLRTKSGMKINDLTGEIDMKTKFYILGLSPNAARISIRFFYSDTFGGFVEKVAQHYKDMELVKDFNDRPDNIPLWMMLGETMSPKSREKKVIFLLAGAVMRSIVSGISYPASLFNAVMIRIKNDMDDKDKNIHRVNYVRVAMIKAYLTRKARIQNNKNLKEVLSVSLNEKSTKVEYLLGRLFSILEKAQQDANPDLNKTIKDRYFASASATPAVIFPILLKLVQHYIAKSEYGFFIERKIGEIMNQITEFPSYLTLEQQGLFVLGYYHQRVALFQKIDKKEN